MKRFDDTQRKNLGMVHTIPTLKKPNNKAVLKQHSFRCSEQLYQAFRSVYARLGLGHEQAVVKAIEDFICSYASQTNTIINVYRPVSCTINVADKAELFTVKQELADAFDALDATETEKARVAILVDMAKLVKKAQDLYRRTRDPDLEALLKKNITKYYGSSIKNQHHISNSTVMRMMKELKD